MPEPSLNRTARLLPAAQGAIELVGRSPAVSLARFRSPSRWSPRRATQTWRLTPAQIGIGVGSTTLGFGWSTGHIYTTVAKPRRVTFKGELQPWVTGKDLVLELLRRWGAKQSQGMSVEFVDAQMQLPIAYRNTICNMMAEAESWNGIFAPDDVTYAWFDAKGMKGLPYPRIAPGSEVEWALDETLVLVTSEMGRMPKVGDRRSGGVVGAGRDLVLGKAARGVAQQVDVVAKPEIEALPGVGDHARAPALRLKGTPASCSAKAG